MWLSSRILHARIGSVHYETVLGFMTTVSGETEFITKRYGYGA